MNSFLARLFLFLTATTLLQPLAFAETSVWKVQKDEATVYVGGTIHVLRPSDYPLPVEFEHAFQTSQIITFETDIRQMNSPKLAHKMLMRLSYSDERTIKSEVSPETYALLSKYATASGISLNFMRKAKPGMLMSALMLAELRKIGVSQQGIDLFFLNRTEKEGKLADFLETPEEQIEFLADMGVGNEEAFYQNMLRDFKNTQKLFATMIKHWRTGNSEDLDLAVNQVMKAQSPKIFQSILVDRNNNWLPVIENYFETSEIEFVLVGAAHLIGEEGLIYQLKQKGYQVSKL